MMMNMATISTTKVPQALAGNPFSLSDESAYANWRHSKLARRPRSAEDLVVPIHELCALSAEERNELTRRCRNANLAIYECPQAADKHTVRKFGIQLGLIQMDNNLCADDDSISSIEARSEKLQAGYIPYSKQRLNWHTDGYYNPPGQHIQAFILHCVRDAASGGVNEFMDPEIAYILIRDKNPEYIRALMHPLAMTIPANQNGDSVLRQAQTGPVYFVDPINESLNMRYTARIRSIQWRQDTLTRNAVSYLVKILSNESRYKIRYRLRSGQGIVCNNVLHCRSSFRDDPPKSRLMYRARYYDRIDTTNVQHFMNEH